MLETALKAMLSRETVLKVNVLKVNGRNAPMDLVLLVETTLKANVLRDLMVRVAAPVKVVSLVNVRGKAGKAGKVDKAVLEQGCRHCQSLWCLIAMEMARSQKKR